VVAAGVGGEADDAVGGGVHGGGMDRRGSLHQGLRGFVAEAVVGEVEAPFRAGGRRG
jgi:hypothetical protein